MRRQTIFAMMIAATIALTARPAQPQVGEAAAANVVAPIIVHIISPPKKPASGTWLKAEILHADANEMVVSEQGNERMIHTFTFADGLKDRMQKIVDKGGYQYGDRVNILYLPGGNVALKVHGKPSKSS